jgi:hypothetical protein
MTNLPALTTNWAREIRVEAQCRFLGKIPDRDVEGQRRCLGRSLKCRPSCGTDGSGVGRLYVLTGTALTASFLELFRRHYIVLLLIVTSAGARERLSTL